MITIPWRRSTPTTEYYQHGNYMLKKRVIQSATIYLIYDGDEVKFNTNQYFKFMKIAEKILRDERFNWRDC